MNPRTIRTLLGKELLDTLRDKRTLIMMIGVPLLLYPALTLVGFQLALVQHRKLESTVSRVAVVEARPGPVRDWVGGIPRAGLIDSATPDEDLAEGRLDAVVVVPEEFNAALAEQRTAPIEVRYDATEFASRDAAHRIIEGLREVGDRIQEERLATLRVDKAYITPLDVARKDTASPTRTTGTVLGGILPFFVIVALALGAFYPAVDLTAGEKERGTFETLLATPTSKLEIVTGKFCAVFILAMITGFLNIASMGMTFAVILSQLRPILESRLDIQLTFPLLQLPLMFVLLVPLALFLAAVMMSLAVLARNFKEAQNFVTPFFIVIMFPLFLTAMPGVKLEGAYVFVPIANVALLFKEMLVGRAGMDAVFLVLVSTAVFAALALLLAAWLFQREDVVLSEERGLALSLRRGDATPADVLTPGAAVGLFGFLMLLLFYIGATVQAWSFVAGLLLTEWVLLLLPTLVVLRLLRVRMAGALNLQRLSRRNACAAILIGAAWLPLIVEATLLVHRVFPAPDEFAETFGRMFAEGVRQAGAPLVVLIVVVSPAVCEEVVFRGALLSAFRPRLGNAATVIAVGLLFGVLHLNLYRFAPTALTGMVLTYVGLRAGSIFAPMLVHAVFNGAALLLQYAVLPEALQSALDPEHLLEHGLPWWVLFPAIAFFALGVAFLEARGNSNRES
ncbi:MAG TPA: ABC transporter permease subunit/CPBP intramembrane protease [Candidatus Hydrogenedentes bacterium]|nr:ABC transporter permease subunit/CPBP intramembrane protease [Candidatus Hydrogenedentota bacterium]